eukprot:COSAG01_NODE_2609_length_7389_cov_19.579467_8_plen_209_part_00
MSRAPQPGGNTRCRASVVAAVAVAVMAAPVVRCAPHPHAQTAMTPGTTPQHVAPYPQGTCAVTGEYDQAQQSSCAAFGPKSTITGIKLAYFGTPSGSCAQGWKPGPCQKDVAAGVFTLCKGKTACAVTCLGAIGGANMHPLTPREPPHLLPPALLLLSPQPTAGTASRMHMHPTSDSGRCCDQTYQKARVGLGPLSDRRPPFRAVTHA